MSTDARGRVEAPTQLLDSQGIVAEVHLDHERLLLRPTLRELGDVSIVPGNRARRDGREYQFVSIRTDSVVELDSVLATDPTVSNPMLVERHADRLVYRVELTPDVITLDGAIAGHGGRIREATGTQTAWILKLRLPSREALIDFNDECKRDGISVRVTQLRTDDGETPTCLGLTDKQQELLTVAYEEGYFDVPRGISQDELAAKLGVSKSAISQRLRRAMTELCASSFGPGSR
ncbi:helix-turn-helix domain-containing protein [Halovivax gelatinilyticus]|uniref:helix-turn-helix domain-containing protein n=1 Tax=Halovivax gelatinilyticus TaxID=2961597 RepID=UPI0020CA9536|nr:helix-turn-helix domain-containing protein [Halovivax gelatinilyticus]